MAEGKGQQEQPTIFQDHLSTIIDRTESDRRVGQLTERYAVAFERDPVLDVAADIEELRPEPLNYFPIKRTSSEDKTASFQLVVDDKRGANEYDNEDARKDEDAIHKNLSTAVVVVDTSRRELHRGDIHDMTTIRSTTSDGDYRWMLDISGDTEVTGGGSDATAGDGVRRQATGGGGEPGGDTKTRARNQSRAQVVTNARHSTGWIFDGQNIGNLATLIKMNPVDRVGVAKDSELIIPPGLQAFFHYEASFGHGPIHLIPGDARDIPEGDGELVKGILMFDSEVAQGSESGRIRPLIRLPKTERDSDERGPSPTPEGEKIPGGSRSRPTTGDQRREPEPSKPREDPQGTNPDPPSNGTPTGQTTPKKDPKKQNQERNLRGPDDANRSGANDGLGANEDEDGDPTRPVTGVGIEGGTPISQTLPAFSEEDSPPADVPTNTGTTVDAISATATTTAQETTTTDLVVEKVGRGAECCLHENHPPADPSDGGSLPLPKVPLCPGEDRIRAQNKAIDKEIDRIERNIEVSRQRFLGPGERVLQQEEANLRRASREAFDAMAANNNKIDSIANDIGRISKFFGPQSTQAKAFRKHGTRQIKKLNKQTNKIDKVKSFADSQIQRTEKGRANLRKRFDNDAHVKAQQRAIKKLLKRKAKNEEKLRKLRAKWKKKFLGDFRGNDEIAVATGGAITKDEAKPICTQEVGNVYEIAETSPTPGSPPLLFVVDDGGVIKIVEPNGTAQEVAKRVIELPTLGTVPVGVEALDRARTFAGEGRLSADALRIIEGNLGDVAAGNVSAALSEAEKVWKSTKFRTRTQREQLNWLTSKVKAMYYQWDGLAGGVFRDFFAGNLAAVAVNSQNLPVMGHSFGQSILNDDVRDRPAVQIFGDITTRPGSGPVRADGAVLSVSILDVGRGGSITDNRALLRLGVEVKGNAIYRGNLLEAGRTTVDWRGRLNLGGLNDIESTIIGINQSFVGTSGPVTDNALARWNGTGGLIIQQAGIIISDTDEMSGVNAIIGTQAVTVPGGAPSAGTGTLWMRTDDRIIFTDDTPTDNVLAYVSEIPAAGAPANAQYVVIALDGTLTDERVITGGTNIALTDGGAGGNITIDVSPQGGGSGLDADTVDGVQMAEFVQRDGSVALTADWDVGANTITVLRLVSDQATGVAPFTVASTTVVTNLNADTVDGIQGAEFLQRDGSVPLTAIWDAGSFLIRAEQFESDVAIGSAPFIVTSTTVVPNLTVAALEESGAQRLTLGAIADGEVLTRIGTTIVGSAAGSGDVTGPASSTDNAIARFNLATGKVIQNSQVLVDDGGHVLAPGGTAGAPAYSFTTDTDTGMHLGTDQLRFVVNSTTMLALDDGANIITLANAGQLIINDAILHGSQSVGQDLHLSSTNDATKGFIINQDPIQLDEQVSSPTAAANAVLTYGLEVSGVTEMHARASDGTITQLTGVSAGVVGDRSIFGDGSDGAVTEAVNRTLTADLYTTAYTVNTGIVVTTDGFRIFCQGTVTLTGTAIIENNGAAGAATTTLGTGAAEGSIGGGADGGIGGATTGSDGDSTMDAVGGAGGAGGTGSSGSGGAASTASNPIEEDGGGGCLRNGIAMVRGRTLFGIVVSGGGGGAGGGGDGTAGGGGGGGAGSVIIIARAIAGTGTITTTGGAGGSPGAGNRGGGGSGGGGFVGLLTETASVITPTAAAGAVGVGSGTGTNGSAGGAGLVVELVMT